MNPKELKYTNDHEWVKIENEFAIVGITNFAQQELGDIVYVDIESLNQKINKGEIFGTVEAVKTVSDLFMPISGEIVEVNHQSPGPDSHPSPQLIGARYPSDAPGARRPPRQVTQS